MPRIKILDKVAPEEGTYPIKFTFKDESGTAIEAANIISLKWWLTDLSGNVINSRSEVTVSSITNPWYLVLSGDDLQMGEVKEDYDFRLVTLKGTYNSTLGSGLHLTHSIMFKVKNLLIIAQALNVSVADMVFTGEDIGV